MPDLNLQQSNNSIFLVQVTSRAGNHNILGAIGAALRQGDNMINMVLSANFGLTVIALAFLIGVLLANIGLAMSTTIPFYQCASSMLAHSAFIWMVLCILLESGLALLRMSLDIGFSLFSMYFCVKPTLCSHFISMNSFILTIIFSVLFNPCLFIGMIGLYILRSMGFTVYRSTYFTSILKTTFYHGISGEVLSSSRKRIVARATNLLGYTGVHDKACSLSSARGCFQHRSGKTLLPQHYTIHPPVEQVYRLFIMTKMYART